MAKLPDRPARDPLATVSTAQEIDRFVRQASASNGRLIFALDATLSRQPTWDRACRLQGELFQAVGETGALAVQLVYFRGFSECRASRWVVRSQALLDLMMRIDCRGGQTQIGRVLRHAKSEARKEPTQALVFIGDAMEEEADELAGLAGELGVLGVRCFMVQEGLDRRCEQTFREVARLSGGAYLRLAPGSADALRNLLRAVAAFAANGLPALAAQNSAEGRLLLEQVRDGRTGGRS